MADLLQELITTADFPTSVCRALQGARLLVDAGDTAAAIDRMAVTLTAELQDQSPVVLGVLPGGAYLLGALMQRMVFPLQIAHCGFDEDEPTVAGALPSLTDRLVVVVDDGQMSESQEKALLAALSGLQVGPVWHCSVIKGDASSGFARQLGLVTTDPSGVFGCGLDVLGYCRNLSSLYRTA